MLSACIIGLQSAWIRPALNQISLIMACWLGYCQTTFISIISTWDVTLSLQQLLVFEHIHILPPSRTALIIFRWFLNIIHSLEYPYTDSKFPWCQEQTKCGERNFMELDQRLVFQAMSISCECWDQYNQWMHLKHGGSNAIVYAVFQYFRQWACHVNIFDIVFQNVVYQDESYLFRSQFSEINGNSTVFFRSFSRLPMKKTHKLRIASFLRVLDSHQWIPLTKGHQCDSMFWHHHDNMICTGCTLHLRHN